MKTDFARRRAAVVERRWRFWPLIALVGGAAVLGGILWWSGTVVLPGRRFTHPPIYGHFGFRISVLALWLIPAGLLAGAVGWVVTSVRRVPSWAALVVIVASGWFSAIAINLVRGSRRELYDGVSTDLNAPYYTRDLHFVDQYGVRGFVQHFPELIKQLGAYNGKTHPPGVQVFLWTVSRLVGGHPFRFATVLAIISLLIAVGAWAMGRAYGGERAGRIAAVLAVAAPGPLMLAYTNMDAIFAAFFSISAGLFVIGARRRSAPLALAGGAVAGLATFLTYATSFLVLAVVVAVAIEVRRPFTFHRAGKAGGPDPGESKSASAGRDDGDLTPDSHHGADRTASGHHGGDRTASGHHGADLDAATQNIGQGSNVAGRSGNEPVHAVAASSSAAAKTTTASLPAESRTTGSIGADDRSASNGLPTIRDSAGGGETSGAGRSATPWATAMLNPRPDRTGLRETARLLGAGAVGGLAVLLLLRLTLGFDLWACYQARNHSGGPFYPYWMVGHPESMLLWAGLPIAALGVFGLIVAVPGASRPWLPTVLVTGMIVWGLLPPIVTDLRQGEVERTWSFLYPMLAASAGPVVAYWTRSLRLSHVWAGSVVFVLIVLSLAQAGTLQAFWDNLL